MKSATVFGWGVVDVAKNFCIAFARDSFMERGAGVVVVVVVDVAKKLVIASFSGSSSAPESVLWLDVVMVFADVDVEAGAGVERLVRFENGVAVIGVVPDRLLNDISWRSSCQMLILNC